MCALLMAAVLAGTQQAWAAVETSGGVDTGNAWVGDHVSFWLRVRNDQNDAATLRVQVVGNGITLVALFSPLRRTDGAPCSPPPASIEIAAQSESLLSGTLSVVDSGDRRVALQTMDQARRARSDAERGRAEVHQDALDPPRVLRAGRRNGYPG